MAEIRLLGAVEVWAAGKLLPTGQPKQRSVLATLAVDAGRLVTWDTLVYRVWGDSPPNGVRAALYSYVTRLRQLLGQAAAHDGEPSPLDRGRSGGYVLRIDPDKVDLHRFRDLVDRSRAANVSAQAAMLREALALWRGEALSGISGHWAARMREGWRQERMDAVVSWAQAEQRLGRPGVVIGPLADMLAENPLVEPLALELMRALCSTGRRAEALDCFAVMRHRLVEELGAEPGTELRELHQHILRDTIAPDQLTSPGARYVPAQLPRNIPGFTGRDVELARLDSLSADGRPVAVVVGTAGIGKTTLAVHWGHRASGRFPDGQLYLNLRGFDPDGRPTGPATAVRGFLEALDVPQPRLPTDFDAQVALYRSLLAGKRILVVLDNAYDAEQIRPLLPAARGCMAVVTSRNHLPGLVVTEGAHPIHLDLLSTNESLDLLSRRLGHARVDAEPAAAVAIVERCARLPLALAIVAARAVTHPGLTLAGLALELADTQARLDALDTGDQATQIRAVFSWSYTGVSRSAARIFRLLGLPPGPDISLAAAASLADLPIADIRPLLAELAEAHLINEHAPGRFTLHDLLRAYAAEQPESHRHAATHRLLDHYLHSANAADRLTNPHRDPITLPAAQPGSIVDGVTDVRLADAWLTTEHHVLLTTINHAMANGWDTHTWQLGWILAHSLYRRGYWHDQVSTGRAAVAAAQRVGDVLAQSRTSRSLARAYLQLGDYDRAQTHLGTALNLADGADDQVGQADAHHILGWVLERKGCHTEAFASARQALTLYRTAGHVSGEARALNTIGWFHAQLGDHHEALRLCEGALDLHQKLGHREGQAATWHSLGYTRHHLGQHERALTCYQHALALFRDLHDRYYEGDTLARIGDTHRAAGHLGPADIAWRLALTILDDLNHPDAEDVRKRIAVHS